jgi:hypothetical protein
VQHVVEPREAYAATVEPEPEGGLLRTIVEEEPKKEQAGGADDGIAGKDRYCTAERPSDLNLGVLLHVLCIACHEHDWQPGRETGNE